MIFESYFYLLFAVGILTAAVSTAVGFLGGTILLAAMGQFIAPPLLIPIHGIAQLWSNTARFFILRRHVLWPVIRKYTVGAALGAWMGSFFLRSLRADIFSLILGVFILIVTLLSKEKWSALAANVNAVATAAPTFLKVMLNKWVILGFVASSLGLVVGAVGPLVGSFFLLESMDKKQMIATQAVCQSLAHLFKVMVYLYLGFHLAPWTLLIGGLILSGVVGSILGAWVLDKMPGDVFMKIFKWLVVVLSLRLVWLGIQGG